MPFGPVNGPVTFIAFMHDMDSCWKDVATARGVPINDNNNTRMIVDDLFNYLQTFRLAMTYLRAQLQVCRTQNLSLSLKKCVWFPNRVEFVGVDVGLDGNRPAQSKHQLLETWPLPSIVRDVASFIGFAVFYSQFIPMFEVRVTRLREIMKLEYEEAVSSHWDTQAQREWDDICDALLKDPCLKRYDAVASMFAPITAKTDLGTLRFNLATIMLLWNQCDRRWLEVPANSCSHALNLLCTPSLLGVAVAVEWKLSFIPTSARQRPAITASTNFATCCGECSSRGSLIVGQSVLFYPTMVTTPPSCAFNNAFDVLGYGHCSSPWRGAHVCLLFFSPWRRPLLRSFAPRLCPNHSVTETC
jgi:hypothetical protein